MPGVAQVWFTDDELGRVETWAEEYTSGPFDQVEWAILNKIRAAREAVACPTTPAKEERMIKTDGKPTIAWDPRVCKCDGMGLGICTCKTTPPPPPPGPSAEHEELDIVGALTLAP
jgi:hypothetical protein